MFERAVLIIGIDGGTWSVLRPAILAGAMPHLAGLLDEAAWGVCESTVPAITPAAWSSFQVGAGPGRTGIVDFTEWDRQKRTYLPADTRRLPRTMWEVAGSAGARVGVMNLPMSWPPRAVNGYLVSGLMTPSFESGFTWPPDLAVELLEANPGYHLFDLDTVVDEASHESLDSFLDWICAIVEGRSRAARWLISKEPLDLFMVHFQAVDILQHVLWAYLDPQHPRFDIGRNQLIQERFFGTLDREIARIRGSFAASTSGAWLTLMISDHGFQTHIGRFSLWQWLKEEGFLQVDLTGATMTPLVRLKEENIDEVGPPLDFERSSAFSTGRSNEAFIYLLEQGEARKRTGNVLRKRLEEIRDPVTGHPVVERVMWREELYHGDRMGELPDLIVVPAGGWSVTGRWEPDPSLFRPIIPGEDFHVGRHHPDGIVVAAGSGVKRGEGCRARLIDIAPTVLACMGITSPSEMDGVPLQALFEAELSTSTTAPLRKVSDDETADEPVGDAYTPEEKALIEKRLKDLGYL
ncbi:alkaline phosphatase family protein [Candidatus Zixiibacteriota bacterium]